jgi:hypothetical protein
LSGQQYIILARGQGPGTQLDPIGTRQEILEKLARLNTMPEREGEDVLYGPGICIQMPPGNNSVSQMIMTVNEEEIAWQVVSRVIKALECKLLDPETGRELGT